MNIYNKTRMKPDTTGWGQHGRRITEEKRIVQILGDSVVSRQIPVLSLVTSVACQ